MKKYVIFGAVAVVILVVSIVIVCNSCVEKIYLDEDSSYFSDFSVKNNKVFIRCSITLENTYKIEKTVSLSANMGEDVRIGLLKQSQTYAMNEDGTKSNFTIRRKSRQTFDVVFVGDYAGTNKKYDRLLPDIKIETIN